LLAVAATGLALLALRGTGAMGLLLAVHLGTVLALFVLLPYSKMVHGAYRAAALLRDALQ
jgi:citrate/tricarballylate utilization protein